MSRSRVSGSMLGAGSQRGMEMTSNAGNTVGLGAREGSNPFYPGNQEAPQKKRHSSCVLKEEQMCERRKASARALQEPTKGTAWRSTGAGAGGARDVEERGHCQKPLER